MRKVTVVRLGVAAAVAAMGVAGAVGSGCSSSTAVTTPTVDSGTSEDSGPCTGGTGCVVPDSGTVDSGPCQGGTGCTVDSGVDSATPPPANLVLAHAAPGVPPFRVCFSTASAGQAASVLPLSALPDSPSAAPGYPTTGPYPGVVGAPGIYPGTIGAFPSLGESYKTFTVTPYAVLSSSITNDVNYDAGNGINTLEAGATEEDCEHLIGTHGLGVGPDPASGATNGRLTLGTDFFPLPTIPAGTLLDTNTYLLTVNGCLPGGTPAGVPQECGANYDGGVTANIGIAQLDTTTPGPDGGIGVQFAHRATAIENVPIICPSTACGVTLTIHGAATDGVLPAVLQESLVDGGEEAGLVTEITPFPLGATPDTYGGTTITSTVAVGVTPNAGSLFSVSVLPGSEDGGAPNNLPWPGTVAVGASGPVAVPGDVIAIPLSDIFQLSRWDVSTLSAGGGAQFSAGQNYTFILVGDPLAAQLVGADGGANPVYDGRGVHILAFPNTFVPLPAPGQ